ncbi:hypothetical protein PV10_03948 [Exophiala mesophila]|uniref:WW domain-containing protein n=1 Tax=Exophiala mesophila TaxID=212818 RepID=A0A0D1WTX3_EXOME|nr:uncharacterized protein PV10_03948 [Exophiala mesophila]KIV92675.1 hypothetical protein PV10_03948 [Exophiala mesophila]
MLPEQNTQQVNPASMPPGVESPRSLGQEDGEISDHASASSQHPQTVELDDAKVAEPPLPLEPLPPPLPSEEPPSQPVDDGWEPVWDDQAQAFYFYNKFTRITQWENPRVPEANGARAPGTSDNDQHSTFTEAPPAKRVGGYDPSIHGDYDPNADYAKMHSTTAQDDADRNAHSVDAADVYAATASFNRFTGRWQRADLNPENYSDEQKSRRQMNAFFDVDAAANSHDGRSLRAERAGKKLTKAELKAFKEKRREKKEEKRRAWLRD